MPIIICVILPAYLCIGYAMCIKTMLIVMKVIHKSAIHELDQVVTTFSIFVRNELLL